MKLTVTEYVTPCAVLLYCIMSKGRTFEQILCYMYENWTQVIEMYL
jgi:hypothetical protein